MIPVYAYIKLTAFNNKKKQLSMRTKSNNLWFENCMCYIPKFYDKFKQTCNHKKANFRVYRPSFQCRGRRAKCFPFGIRQRERLRDPTECPSGYQSAAIGSSADTCGSRQQQTLYSRRQQWNSS